MLANSRKCLPHSCQSPRFGADADLVQAHVRPTHVYHNFGWMPEAYGVPHSWRSHLMMSSRSKRGLTRQHLPRGRTKGNTSNSPPSPWPTCAVNVTTKTVNIMGGLPVSSLDSGTASTSICRCHDARNFSMLRRQRSLNLFLTRSIRIHAFMHDPRSTMITPWTFFK